MSPRPGYLPHKDLEDILRSLDLKMQDYHLHSILSEIEMNEDGLVSYKEFIPICVDLLMTFKAKEKVNRERSRKEEDAMKKAQEIVANSSKDINFTVHYIMDNVKLIDETIEDEDVRVRFEERMIHLNAQIVVIDGLHPY
jgi:hypothetical protein